MESMPLHTTAPQAACCDYLCAKMRMKLRNEGYQSRLAFLQSGFLILQKFSLQLLSLSFNSTRSTKTESLPSSSQALWSSVPSHHLYTHPALSHILEVDNRSPENDDASAPMTPGYKFPPSFIECLMLIRMLVTTFKTEDSMLLSRLLEALYSLTWTPLSFNPSLTKPLCAHWGLMASRALMTCSSRTGSHLFPCHWVCTPELALLLLTTDSRSTFHPGCSLLSTTLSLLFSHHFTQASWTPLRLITLPQTSPLKNSLSSCDHSVLQA